MYNILLGVTGSVASIKANKLIEALKPLGDVKVVATKAGRYFLDQQEGSLSSINKGTPTSYLGSHVFYDEDEWPEIFQLGDKVLHIELRRWASCLVLAPLDANTLAKASLGLCDNLLTSTIRAWDWTKPVFMCPSMNTVMMEHPITNIQLDVLKNWGATVIPPQSKKLACGDVGIGAMADISKIVEAIKTKMT